MAVMMNTLGRRAQAQSDTSQTTEQGDSVPKEKVNVYSFQKFALCSVKDFHTATSPYL